MLGQLKNSATHSRLIGQSVWEAAEFYASEFGWPVFPCHSIRNGKCTCSKGAACTSTGKHPITANGFKAATTDLRQIRTWAIRHPDANIAIATGNGLAVIDVDPRNGGDATLAALEAEQGQLSRTHVVRTGGGGLHIFLTVPVRASVNCNSGKLGPGIDIKAKGGYVVAAPSNHISGGAYVWEGPLSLTKPAGVPEAWLQLMPKVAEDSGVRQECTKATDSILTICSPPLSDVVRQPAKVLTDTDNLSELLDPFSETGKRVLAVLQRCGVTGPEQTNKNFPALATGLKNIPALRNLLANSLLPVLWRFYDDGKDFMSQKDWLKIKERWFYLWNNWSKPCVGPAWEAAKVVVASGELSKAAESVRPGLDVLKALCTEIQRTADPKTDIWYISCRTASDVLESIGIGCHYATASEWLRELVGQGFLIKAERRTSGSPLAQRYMTKEVAARHNLSPLTRSLSQAGRDEPEVQPFSCDLADNRPSVSQRSAVLMN